MQFSQGVRHDLLWRNHLTVLQWAPTLTAHNPNPPLPLLEPLILPTNSVLPILTTDGTPQVGETVSCSTGTWLHSPTSYAYQWTRDGGNIATATSSTYALQAADDGHLVACRVTATNADGSTPATSAAITPSAVPPANTVAPALTTDGTPNTGETISCSTGTWSNLPASYAYQWKRTGSPIGGATSATYALQVADEGQLIKCTVTATNSGGSVAADSNTVTPVAGPPVNSVAPVITTDGTPTTGDTISCSSGTWSGSPSFEYQWKRNGVAISGATSSNYTLQAADEGESIRCTVSATNPGGTITAESNTITAGADVIFLKDLEFDYAGQDQNMFTKDLAFDYEGRDTLHFTVDLPLDYAVAVPHGGGMFRRRRELV